METASATAVVDNGGLPEFRRNPLTGDWVLYAAERAARPNDFRVESGTGDCPFCPGNEGLTPPEILAGRPDGSPPNSPDWRWRIFANKFPALTPARPGRMTVPPNDDWRPALGRHEILIETPRHDASLADLTREEVLATLRACTARLSALEREPEVRYAFIFKNHGQGSGASLRHPHFQIVALPFVPDRIRSQTDHAKEQFDRAGACTYCDLIEREHRERSRLIYSSGEIVVFAPRAGRFSGEVWIMPARHSARLQESSDDALAEAAAALRNLVIALREWAGEAPYNLVILPAPSGADCARFFHWRIELIPRLTGVAGFEWATGIHVNQVTPEDAARRFREKWGRTTGAR